MMVSLRTLVAIVNFLAEHGHTGLLAAVFREEGGRAAKAAGMAGAEARRLLHRRAALNAAGPYAAWAGSRTRRWARPRAPYRHNAGSPRVRTTSTRRWCNEK